MVDHSLVKISRIMMPPAVCIARPEAEVIKHFSCSTQLSMKFKLLINIKIAPKLKEFSGVNL